MHDFPIFSMRLHKQNLNSEIMNKHLHHLHKSKENKEEIINMLIKKAGQRYKQARIPTTITLINYLSTDFYIAHNI